MRSSEMCDSLEEQVPLSHVPIEPVPNHADVAGRPPDTSSGREAAGEAPPAGEASAEAQAGYVVLPHLTRCMMLRCIIDMGI